MSAPGQVTSPNETGRASLAPVPATARAARIQSPSSGIQVMPLVVPEVGPTDVLVRSAAVGICGSDVSALKGSRPAAFIRYPLIPGHEWSGTLASVGAAVTGWVVGDRVAVAGLRFCDECVRCRSGEPNLCQAGYAELGFTEPGGLAEYVAVPARQLVSIPGSMSLIDAALLEPAAVVALATACAGELSGRAVAVVGDGTLGQLAAQFARLGGASDVTVFGTGSGRLATAAALGAHETFDVGDGAPNRRYRRRVHAGGADVVIETGGSVSAVELALALLRRGGRAVLTGVAGGDAHLTLPSDLFVVSHLTVRGVVGSTPQSWQHAVSLAGSGQLRLAPLVTHHFGLAEVARAYDAATQRAPGTLKVLIEHEPPAALPTRGARHRVVSQVPRNLR